ncbi:hypothetical protein D3C75_491830 [compost metagenome]
MKTHFMFGRMHIHIHLMRVDFQVQHKRRLLVGTEFVFTGLADSVIDQAVAHHATVHIAILNLCQGGSRRRRFSHPAAQCQVTMLPFNGQRLFEESRTANRAKAAFARCTLCNPTVLTNHFAVVSEIYRHIKTRQRNTSDYLINVIEFGFFGAHEFATCGRVVEQIQHLKRGSDWMCRRFYRHILFTPFGIGLPRFALLGGARG